MPTILITGANRGLGFEFARQYSQEDWHVIATCRNLGQATHLESLSGKIEIKRLDVADFSSIEECSDNLGEIPIDVLLLNAGVFPQKGTSLAETDFEMWKGSFLTNSISAAKLALSFKQNILASKQKKIIALSSKAGSMSENKAGGNFIYRSSKAALNSIIVGLASEFQDNRIICTAIIPGMTQTDMGGATAPRIPQVSVQDMRSVISALTMKNSGTFLNFDGKELLW